MAQKQKKKLAGDTAKVVRQRKIIEHLKKKENWMKWGLAAALIIILLLLLFIGYATDWTTGLKKDKATTPIGTSSDSSKSSDGTGTPAPTSGSGAGTTGGASGTGSTGSSGTSTTTNNTTTPSTEKSSSSTSTTTNNSSTTTNNNTTTTQSTGPLRTLYSQTGAGDAIDEVISQAQSLGISVDCTDTLLVKECTFTAGGESFSTKSVSGVVTSILGL